MTGHIFEKTLIETYIQENGTDPINNQELVVDDLILVNTTKDPVVRPRPPTMTSIPALLSAFQSEWDAVALETFSLRQQLKQTRQELSTALYHHDAAIRVAARLTTERDEARESLSQLAASIGTPAVHELANGASNGASNGETKQEATEPLPETSQEQPESIFSQDIIDAISTKRQELTVTRKKRKSPTGWATVDEIKTISSTPQYNTKQLFTTVTSLTSDSTGQFILTGGGKSQAGVFSIESQSVVAPLKSTGIVTGVAWTTENSLLLGTKNGHIDVYEYNGEEQSAVKTGDFLDLSSQGRVVALKSHPVSSLVVAISTVPTSKSHPQPSSSLSLVQTKPETGVLATFSSEPGEVYTSTAIHPDGLLIAVGTANGTIKILNLLEGCKLAATFDIGEQNSTEAAGEVTALSFSENGYWLVSASSGLPGVAQLWDLRKLTQTFVISFPTAAAAATTTDEGGAIVQGLTFDYTGQFLAAVTGTGVLDVVGYVKSSKSWTTESLFATSELALPVTSNLVWGAFGKSLATISHRGVIQAFKIADDGDNGDVEMQG